MARMSKHQKMWSCVNHTYVDDYLDYCAEFGEYPCDAPTDYPLWEQCEDCTYYKAKKGECDGSK